MKITAAKWENEEHTICRVVIDGMTSGVPEGSPHWPYLQKAIVEGLAVEPPDSKPMLPTPEQRAVAEVDSPIVRNILRAVVEVWETKARALVSTDVPDIRTRYVVNRAGELKS